MVIDKNLPLSIKISGLSLKLTRMVAAAVAIHSMNLKSIKQTSKSLRSSETCRVVGRTLF